MSLQANPSFRSGQSGATLVVVLILLLVMTLLALASMRGTLMEERMTANQYDRSLSFQAAEAALREGEALAAGRPNIPAGCNAGLCGIPDPEAAPVWENANVWAAARQTATEYGAGTLALQPQYIVELLADNVPPKGSCTTTGDVSIVDGCTGTERRYRITARSQEEGRAVVVLQSVYAVP
jgi:type IV pilus assembly protein PilX